LATIRCDQSQDRFDQRALARAVRPQQTHGARRERRGHVAKCPILRITHVDVLELDDASHLQRFNTFSAAQKVPRRPRTSAFSRMNRMTLAACSSSESPKPSAPVRRSSLDTARANALSFIRLMTEGASRSRTLFDGRTRAAAVTNPAISSHAKSAFSSRLSRATPE